MMRKNIKQYCRSCRFCQLVKTNTSKKPGSLHLVETPPPLYTLCIDFVETLPASRGCNSLATVTEKFTKAVALISCKKSTSTMEFAKLFFKRIYPMWGMPEKIISDRDRRFTSTFRRTLMELTGTKVALTTGYHPQADSQSERTNCTIDTMLRILVLEALEITWTEFLPIIELVHNTTPHTTSGESPFDLLYSVSPKSFGEMSAPQRLHSSHSLKAEEWASQLRERRSQALQALKLAQSTQKKYYDQKHAPISFLLGEIARLCHSGTFKRKLKLDPTTQLVRVVKMVSPGTYRIKTPEGSRMHDVVSVKHLRKYTGRLDEALLGEVDPDTSEKKEAVRVCGDRRLDEQWEFLVVYEGEEELEWVEETDCDGLQKLIAEYKERSRRGAGQSKRFTSDTVEYMEERPLMIDGIEANEGITMEKSPRRSGRMRKAWKFFDQG